MVRVDDVPLLIADRAVPPTWAFDLGEILYAPQTQLPESYAHAPPARPPFAYDYSPGTLYWPQGASRFALGQYLVTAAEANLIRAAVGEDVVANPVTLTLGGQAGQDDQLDFLMHVLHLLPLQFHYAAGDFQSPPDAEDAVYLLLLVDYRFFLQAKHPTWTIDETTTWGDLDADCEAFLGDATFDAVDADYLQPGTQLAAPALATEGVLTNAGYLLDAIGLASGRRFVANRDGSYHMQSVATARALHDLGQETYKARRRHGGDLAFPVYAGETLDEAATRDHPARHVFLVPHAVTVVFPGTDGTNETAPYEATVTFASVEANLTWTTNAYPFREGTLRVGSTHYNDGSNDADCDALAERFATDWYEWLSAPELTCYSGVAGFEPDGFCDSTLWVTRQDDVATYVRRGLLNPRPGPILGYSGVDAPPGGGGSGIRVVASDGSPDYLDVPELQVIEADGFTLIGTTGVYARIGMNAAGAGVRGNVTADAQEFDGLKTFLNGADMDVGQSLRTLASSNQYGRMYSTLTGATVATYWEIHNTGADIYDAIEILSATASYVNSMNFYVGGTNGTIAPVLALTNVLGTVNVAFITDGVGINGMAGATGTDSVGNVFEMGFCTTVGSGGGGVTSVNGMTGAVTIAPDAGAPGVTVSAAGGTVSLGFLANLDYLNDVDTTGQASGDVLTFDGTNWVADTVTLGDGTVTFAKLQDISTDRLLGRDTAGTGDVEEIAVQGGIEFNGGGFLQLQANGVSDTKLRDSVALSVIGRSANSTGDPGDIVAGTAGHVLRRTGTTLGFSAPPVGGQGVVATATKSSNYTAVAGDLVVCDTSGGAFTVTLPASPNWGDRVGVFLLTAGNNLTVGRNGETIDGAAADLTVSAAGTLRVLQYGASGWLTVAAEGQSVLGSPFTLTSTGTFQDTGLSVALPVAGYYEIMYNARVVIQVSGNDGWVSVRLYNATDSAAVANTDRLVFYVDPGDTYIRQLQSAFSHKIYVAGAKTIRLDGMRQSSGSPTWTYSLVSSDSNGRTVLGYRRCQ